MNTFSYSLAVEPLPDWQRWYLVWTNKMMKRLLLKLLMKKKTQQKFSQWEHTTCIYKEIEAIISLHACV